MSELATAQVAAPPTMKRLYLTAGWGGIGAFVAWLLQPLLVFIISPGREEREFPVWETIESYPYDGLFEVIVFAGIGVALLFLVLGTDALIRRSGGGQSVSARVGTALGVVAASVWFLVAGVTLAPYTSLGTGIPDLTGDETLQAIILDLPATFVIGGATLAFILPGAGWIVSVITAGRRAGIVGIPLTVAGAVTLLGPVLVLAIPFSPPWGAIGVLGYALILGIVFLFKARKA